MINSIRWLQESEPVRQEFIEKFDLKKSGGRTVENNRLVSDGISGEELYHKLNIPSLQKFTGVDSTDVYELFAVAAEIIKAELDGKANQSHEKPVSTKKAPPAGPQTGSNDSGTGTPAKRRGGKKEKSEGSSVSDPV